jgi:hypothetical protein
MAAVDELGFGRGWCGSLEFCNSFIGEGGSEPMLARKDIMTKAEKTSDDFMMRSSQLDGVLSG